MILLEKEKESQENPTINVGPHPYGEFVPSAVFSFEAHDNLIKDNGFKATHWKHALNPNRKTVEAGIDLSEKKKPDVSGFFLYDPMPLHLFFEHMTWTDLYTMQGIHGSFNIQAASYTSQYDTPDREKVSVSVNDIFMIDNGMTVLVRELFEYTPGIPQKLKFPIVGVDYLSNGNYRFELGRDYLINDGKIEWISRDNLSYDIAINKGNVLSIAYYTKPYFMVTSTPKIFRTVWANKEGNAGYQREGVHISGTCVLKMLWLESAGNLEIPNF